MSPTPHAHRPRPQQATARVTTTGRARGPLRSPHATADALVVEHLPFAAKVAANYARRTGHPKEDLEQLAAAEFFEHLEVEYVAVEQTLWRERHK